MSEKNEQYANWPAATMPPPIGFGTHAWWWKAGRVRTPDQIAVELHCHPQTVRMHVARFNQRGIDGLGVQSGSGRKPRLTEAERSVIVALPSQPPPGRLVTQRDGTMVARDESGSA